MEDLALQAARPGMSHVPLYDSFVLESHCCWGFACRGIQDLLVLARSEPKEMIGLDAEV